MRIIKVNAVILVIFLLSSCAAHYPDTFEPYGFISGIWHGIVFPLALWANIISWLLSLFDISVFSSIELIGRPNTGFIYYVGYFYGFGGMTAYQYSR